MASFNKIILVGYLGREPELRYTPQGEAVCNFSVATTEKRKNPAGDLEDQTTWFRVTVWRRQAEIANQYLSKGKQVYVEGRLRQVEYTDKDGNRRTTLEVTASDIQFLGDKSANGVEDGGGQPDARQSANAAAFGAQSPPNLRVVQNSAPAGDDDIPF